MPLRLSAVSSDLLRLEESLIYLMDEIRRAQDLAARLPNSGSSAARRTLALAQTSLMSLQEEMASDFREASAEHAAVLDSAYDEVPF